MSPDAGALMRPRVLFLKQTVAVLGRSHYLVEMATAMAEAAGPCELYSDFREPGNVSGVRIVPAPAYARGSMVARLWSWARYFAGATRHVLRSPRSTLLFIVAQPPYMPLLGWLLNRLTGRRYVVWIDDIYPDVIVKRRMLRPANPIVKMWAGLNRLIYSRAEHLFTLGPVMASVLAQYAPADKITTVPTWVDTDGIAPLPRGENAFAIQHGLGGVLTVMYSGNIGLTHDLHVMLEAAEWLRNDAQIRFVIVGGGVGFEAVQRRAADLPNVLVLPLQPLSLLRQSLASADVSVVSQAPGGEGVSMPSKTYFAMAAGSAIIGVGPTPSDLARVIETSACGAHLQPGDVAGFLAAVERFRADPDWLRTCQRNARSAAVGLYSRPVNVARVLDVLLPSLNAGGPAIAPATVRPRASL